MEKEYSKKEKRNIISLVIEIVITCSIVLIVIGNSNIRFKQQAMQTTNEVENEYNKLMTSYVRQFDIVYAQIAQKIQEDPSFEEMDAWLKGMDSIWAEAMGSSDIYDGFSFTYKGDFARSWSYGDYSNYDPTVRDWYKLAEQENGNTAIVPPYVTFLDSQDSADGSYLVMSIVKKYNDEIYVDYDIKLVEMESMLDMKEGAYGKEALYIFDSEGYILSSNEHDKFSHNVFKPDEQIKENFCKSIHKMMDKLGHYDVIMLNGEPTFIYLEKGKEEHYICLTIPLLSVANHDYMVVLISVVFLLLLEVFLFLHNQRNIKEFKDRDERLTALTNAAYDGHVYVNTVDFSFYGDEEAYQYCKSRTYEELFFFIKDRLADPKDGKEFDEFLSKEKLIKNFNMNYKMESKRFTVKWKFAKDRENTRIIEISKLPSMANEKPTYSIAYRDVTESVEVLKEALKQAEVASKAKGSFLSNMSHEIRTPLNAVIGYVEIALDAEGDLQKIQHCLENCKVASKHLLQIINDILDMSSIENGKLKIAHEEFDLKKEIEDITTIYYQNAKNKGVNFETQISDLTEELLIGDQLRLNQILMNLLSNAMKFTPEAGRITLKVQQLDNKEDKVYLQFVVSDTGIGMSQEYMKKLFTAFEQESATTAKKYGGSGLGLSITKNLIAMMGGKIDVDSVQGEGTTFTVTLFFDKSLNQQKNISQNGNYSHVRALVVDDQKEAAAYVKKILARCGVKSDIVCNGEDALKKIRSRQGSEYKFDLCILDWNMPEMDGLEVATRIREEFGKEFPIIIATAYDISELETGAKEAGVNKVVTKPLFQSTIFDLLVTLFGGYTPNTEQVEKKKIDLSGLKIILAEDNEMNMDIACTVLKKTGVEIDPAKNGKIAADLFMNAPANTYNLILMDIQMPVMDGYEATSVIRNSAHPEAKTIPIIAMTANAFAEDVAEALAKGMDAHISKPINNDKLFEIMQKYAKVNN